MNYWNNYIVDVQFFFFKQSSCIKLRNAKLFQVPTFYSYKIFSSYYRKDV